MKHINKNRIKTKFFYRTFNGINEALAAHAQVEEDMRSIVNSPVTTVQRKEAYEYMLHKLLESKAEVASMIGRGK